jgi:alpha/beta superfamily hydrolase
MPCLVVLHGNAASRTIALELVELVCGVYNICLCAFDFAGCGMSQGDHITLGHTEHQQIHAVVTYLQHIYKVGPIGSVSTLAAAMAPHCHAPQSPF